MSQDIFSLIINSKYLLYTINPYFLISSPYFLSGTKDVLLSKSK